MQMKMWMREPDCYDLILGKRVAADAYSEKDAQEMVKRWNRHEELVAMVQRLVGGIAEYKLDATREGGVLGVAWCDAKDLLERCREGK